MRLDSIFSLAIFGVFNRTIAESLSACTLSSHSFDFSKLSWRYVGGCAMLVERQGREAGAPSTLAEMVIATQALGAHFLSWKIALALGSCALLGLRHGFDYDHLAAISDITAVQRTWREGMRLGLTYALGHAFTVVALGAAVVMLQLPLPSHLDAWTERLIGVTLIMLAGLVAGNLFQKRHSQQHSHHGMETRIGLLISAMLHAGWRVRRMFQPSLTRPVPFRWSYSGKSVFFIGVLHGLGAETPSQLMLFLLAASLGGKSLGFLGLLAFAFGLVMMNGVMTATLGGVYKASTRGRAPSVFRWVAVAGAVYSFVVGLIFLLGASGKLPPLG